MTGTDLATWATFFGTLATAIATFFLWRVTKVLAIETKRMADSAAQPQIVANIIPNAWSTIHFDIVVENTGNATAFDIEVKFDPPLTNGEARRNSGEVPLQRISVLKPGQSMTSYLTEVSEHTLQQNYQAETSWRLQPASADRQTLSYQLNMTDYAAVSYLGGRDPVVAIAEQVKKLREDWRNVASGFQKLRVETFSSEDREAETEALRQRHAAEDREADG